VRLPVVDLGVPAADPAPVRHETPAPLVQS
jgi:hypothetical protein